MSIKMGARTPAEGRSAESGAAGLKPGKEPLGISERNYRALFEGMLQGAFFQAADGSLIEVNPRALEIFGLTREEFLNRNSCSPFWKVIREDGSSVPAHEYPSLAVLKTGKPDTDRIFGIFNARSKTYVWVIINAVPQFRTGEKKPYQVYVTLHDITRRKKAEEALRQSQECYRMLMETAPEAIITTDRQGCIVAWNHGAETIYGHKAGKMLGKKFRMLVPERLRKRQDELFALLQKKGEPGYSNRLQEGYGIRKDGSEFIAEMTFNVCQVNNELLFTAIMRDVSERKKIEKRLYESEELFRLSFAHAPIGIAVFDKGGKLREANAFCEQCFGRSMKDFLRQGLAMFLNQDNGGPNLKAFLADHERLRQPMVVENRFFAGDGRVIYTKQYIRGVFDAADALSFIIVLAEDITAARQLSLMGSDVIRRLKDVHTQLNEFCQMLPEEQKFANAKSLSDYDLSPMEVSIAAQILQGEVSKAIAKNLRISENTVKHHITSIYRIFKVKNRLEFCSFLRVNRIFI